MSATKRMPDTILCIDINATCWERPLEQPPGQKNEIIEIGYVPLSIIKLTIGEPKTIIIRPKTSKVSQFCTRITGITQEEVDIGISFKDACQKLIKENDSLKFPYVSYGLYDKKHLEYQCADTKTVYPFSKGMHWNFRDMFARMMGLEHDVSLAIAVKMLGLEFDGVYHRSQFDALNTARVMVECFKRLRGDA